MKNAAEVVWSDRLANRRVLIIGDQRSSAGKRDYFSFDETGTPFHYQVSETGILEKLSSIASRGSYAQIEALHKSDWSAIFGCDFEFDVAIFLYKEGFASQSYERMARDICSTLRSSFPNIEIYNIPETTSICASKEENWRFVEAISAENIPEFAPLLSLKALLMVLNGGDIIVRSDTGAKGRSTRLVSCKGRWHVVQELLKVFLVSLRVAGSRIREITKDRRRFVSLFFVARVLFLRDVILVRRFNNYDPNISAFVSFRVILHFGKIVFAYANANRKDWCVHADVAVAGAISREEYLELDVICDRHVLANVALFERLAEKSGYSFIAFDFIVPDQDILILESEFKFGPGKSFINGKINLYGLDKSFFECKSMRYLRGAV